MKRLIEFLCSAMVFALLLFCLLCVTPLFLMDRTIGSRLGYKSRRKKWDVAKVGSTSRWDVSSDEPLPFGLEHRSSNRIKDYYRRRQ